MKDEIIVKVNQVNKIYGMNHVVKDLNLSVKQGEFLTLLGSSGCGKTTTLRMIAGFEEATSGSILVEGEPVENKEPFERNVNTVFQSYALFPHMTIFDNIAYGLKVKKFKKSEIKEKVSQMLSLVQLEGFEKRYPRQLSGGQKQRVAIARALINNPKVLLLDEPLGALDLKLRKQMQLELKELQSRLGITFLYVTHDQEEALTMSDRIGIMHDGILEQLATPREIYEKPATRFIATFIGETNIFDGRIETVEGDFAKVLLENGSVIGKGEGFVKDELISVSIRPEKLKYSMEPVEGFELNGYVKSYIYVGSVIKAIIVLPNGYEIKLERLASELLPEIGSRVFPYWEVADSVLIHSFDQTFYRAVEDIQYG
ncbi:spermidine/putrescine transport system ATP-binding protein [Anaerosporobacter mobilis DSM 15930]|jgi:spermidine/putrescine transport system ATP-binding protein|uniref:Spermidine/putrescine import ATP-binding protein PotA n=1 Tax=Anaerosporobacter mobilis DSM 15930 TaxID=1120996 RepID=A0A1M7M5N1_9FIRM|nr:ABC transporter ATP-binding protein [Anaerosporobacter mobilis]SHM85947.1 spermidine/putrescine transport system ATP-binding protein [Anaerosporobacter mobilis DSM 15930]